MPISEGTAQWVVGFLNDTDTRRYGVTKKRTINDDALRTSLVRYGFSVLKGENYLSLIFLLLNDFLLTHLVAFLEILHVQSPGIEGNRIFRFPSYSVDSYIGNSFGAEEAFWFSEKARLGKLLYTHIQLSSDQPVLFFPFEH